MQVDTIKPTRRDILAGTAALALATAPTGPARSANPSQSLGAPETTARGTVYELGSSPRKGVPNVMVSNGIDVVKTGDDGGWSLPVREAEATNALVDAGADVITCHVDSPKVVISTAEKRRFSRKSSACSSPAASKNPRRAGKVRAKNSNTAVSVSPWSR